MNVFARAFSRTQPLMGTFFKITVWPDEQREIKSVFIFETMNQAFQEARRLERVFSIFDQESQISLFNRSPGSIPMKVEGEFFDLLQLALDFYRHSLGGFCPFSRPTLQKFVYGKKLLSFQKLNFPIEFQVSEKEDFISHFIAKKIPLELDLNGIAKGFIVDRIACQLEEQAENLGVGGGIVNAGGDIKSFGTVMTPIKLRLGAWDKPVERSFALPRQEGGGALATSSLTVAKCDVKSTTYYHDKLRAPLTSYCTAVAFSKRCDWADGLTKVALFSSQNKIHFCCEKFKSSIWIFDPEGQLIESYGREARNLSFS